MTMPAKAVMIQGTSSDVGKSMLATALCRHFSNAGYRVAPFKSQNMALNSYVTVSGGEIGRAQGVQAEAARVEATTDMNPILLKPKQDMMSEIIVHGKHHLNMTAKSYRNDFVDEALPIAVEAVQRLKESYDVIVLEGAGSPAEINLKARDIANMKMAHAADAVVILVADIDRGGVFASIVGTLALLDEDERARVKGIIINKFRGMKELLDDGLEWLEQYTGIPVLGVVPYMDVQIEAEDSLALSALRLKRPKDNEFDLDVAVIQLPRISNFTDIDPLMDEPGVGVRFVKTVAELKNPDVIIIPGTKNTIDDLTWLRAQGFEEELTTRDVAIVGICGGYQMLGQSLYDPDFVEGDVDYTEGLRLLPIETTFIGEKKTVQNSGIRFGTNERLTGYEIHLGRTKHTHLCEPFLLLDDGRTDGAVVGRILGTYFHGIFHNRTFTRQMVNEWRIYKGLAPLDAAVKSEKELREYAYNVAAKQFEQAVDLEKLYEIIGLERVATISE